MGAGIRSGLEEAEWMLLSSLGCRLRLSSSEEEGGSCPAPSGNEREASVMGEAPGRPSLVGLLGCVPADAK